MYLPIMICNELKHYHVLCKEFLPSGQTYNINFEFNLNEFILLNTHLKESFTMYSAKL